MKKDKWIFYKISNSFNVIEWRWTRKASNGRIVGASSEGYGKKSACLKNAIRNGYFAVAILLLMAISVYAQPFLVCDPQAGVTIYKLTGQPAPLPATSTALADGSLKLDLATCPVGTYNLTVQSCSGVWCSASTTPFTLIRPASPALPANLRLIP